MRACYRLHRLIGLLWFFPLLAITASGVVLLFVDQLRDNLAPYALAEVVQNPLSPDKLVGIIQQTEAPMRLKRLYLPGSNRQAVKVLLQDNDIKRVAFVHPATGDVLSSHDATEKVWLEKLYQFHQGLWLGESGRFIFSLCGIVLLMLWLCGLRLYKAMPGTKKRMRYHPRLGVTLGGLIAAFTLSGALLNYAAPLQRSLKPAPVVPLLARTQTVLSIQELLTIANDIYPTSPLERMYIDHPTQGIVMVRYRDSGRIYLNRHNGQRLQQELPMSHWLDWLYPLHSGRLFDTFRFPILLILGSALLTLSISGMIPMWRRRQRQAIDGIYLPIVRQSINLNIYNVLKKGDSDERRP